MAKKDTDEAPRNDQKEIKKAEKLMRKIERRKLEAAENLLLYSKRYPTKVTRFQMESQIASSMKIISPWNEPIPENPNRNIDPDVEVASNVDEAIQLFKEINNQKRNPHMTEEKIIKLEKKAYQAYEQRMLPILKKENPYMRHPQLMNLVAKQWKRSPENSFRSFWRSVFIVPLVLKEINECFQTKSISSFESFWVVNQW